jgi:SAM-dependent methyltransferase
MRANRYVMHALAKGRDVRRPTENDGLRTAEVVAVLSQIVAYRSRWPLRRARYRCAVRDDGYFDEPVAATYDEDAADRFDPAVLGPTVDFLAELAGDGRALEFGIGTGRVALPLAALGVPLHGIDLSGAMVARLRAKPGGDEIGV